MNNEYFLIFPMMGDIVLHEVGGIDYLVAVPEVSKDGLKFLVGGLSWVFELLEISGVGAVHIRQDGFESTATFVGDMMLLVG